MDWTLPMVIDAVKSRIAQKDVNEFGGGPYAEKWLVICTDEVALEYSRFGGSLRAHGFGPFDQFDAVYLIWSFEPATGSYPWVQLK